MKTARSHTETIVIASLLVTVGVIITVGIYLQNQPRRLYPGEVREYMGENLSSLSDVRDLAFQGTQNINQSTYRLTIDGSVSKPKEYTYDQIVNGFQKYEKVVTLHCIQGWSTKILWEGVR